MSESNASAAGMATAHDPRTDELQRVLEHLSIPLATIIVETAGRVVDGTLAAMGGDLLATYGGSDDPDDRAMARWGGYLLERFGPDRR